MADMIDREQALACFEGWYDPIRDEWHDVEEIPGYEKLEALPSIEYDDDCISRAVTLDALHQSYNLLDAEARIEDLPSAQPETEERTSESAQNVPNDELISKKAAIDALAKAMPSWTTPDGSGEFDHDIQVADEAFVDCMQIINELPSAQPDSKYEYHYDHTDCIWYRPEARNRCPTTCAQYRDGWNDAMNYIFRDGKGYRPYRRDKQYGE